MTRQLADPVVGGLPCHHAAKASGASGQTDLKVDWRSRTVRSTSLDQSATTTCVSEAKPPAVPRRFATSSPMYARLALNARVVTRGREGARPAIARGRNDARYPSRTAVKASGASWISVAARMPDSSAPWIQAW